MTCAILLIRLGVPLGQVRFFSKHLLWETESLRTVVWR